MTDRRYPVGAEFVDGRASFRVFAGACARVDLCIEGQPERRMTREDAGYFSLEVEGLKPGARYRYRTDGRGPFADPASRFQPEGPHLASALVDARPFAWTDRGWRGCRMDGQIIYEMHVGTFTPEGTWAAAIGKLDHLKRTGVTLIEMMPVACFPGTFGWGYDGVLLFAPSEIYGEPDDLRRFVDAAHAAGIGVILDVVYNHLGPDGNYLGHFSTAYFTDRYKNDWGEALNFETDGPAPMRELVLANARYWIEEFHFDGLRLDATQSIFDMSHEHLLSELVRSCRAAAAPRDIVIVGENEPQDAQLMRLPEAGGHGLDALWNDDFHHSAVVAATGRRPAYYEDHFGSPQEFISAAKHGFLFQGQIYFHQAGRRGRPALDMKPENFILFTENHDQVANSATGRRLHAMTSPGRARALAALLLLTPGTPMLFQGQEFGSSAPFFYFADHEGDLADMVAKGRETFLEQFDTLATEEMRARIPRPDARETFEASKLDWSDVERNSHVLALHRDLIALRRSDATLHGAGRLGVDGGVLDRECFYLRYFAADGSDLLLFVNLGPDLIRRSIADPLVAPPMRCGWRLLWSSEAAAYGGGGTAAIERDAGWFIPGQSAVLLRAAPSAQ